MTLTVVAAQTDTVATSVANPTNTVASSASQRARLLGSERVTEAVLDHLYERIRRAAAAHDQIARQDRQQRIEVAATRSRAGAWNHHSRVETTDRLRAAADEVIRRSSDYRAALLALPEVTRRSYLSRRGR